MTAKATGRLEKRPSGNVITFERTFGAPITDVWAAITESPRLERWIGTWTGTPASGQVTFEMNAEGEDMPASRYDIVACEPPRLLHVTTTDDYGSWDLELTLTESNGITTLQLAQQIDDPGMLENTGPGWDYYLDRLVAAETGQDPGRIDFDRDYYPALRAPYQSMAESLGHHR
ncbi:SRPBCC family protein [Propionibacteriaceae bacterium Y1700]|uniref:SRPBCC family protein n=1 Tax=Microlunatus sp. Y1700 TaxID=3418487 RepID=UPI003DA6E50C